MNDHIGMSTHSAKALSELHDKRAKEADQKEAAANLATRLATDQVALLKEANDLARMAHAEALDQKLKVQGLLEWHFGLM